MISVCEPLLGAKELEYVNDCLKTNWISSSGKYIKEFEEKFSAYSGKKYGVSVTNGTTALHLALASLDIKKGDEVIMPTFSIASTAFAAVYCGAKPVFVDSQPDTWNIDPTLIEKKITKRTKAIMPVHMYGHPCDMDSILALAKKYKINVIEDAAEAHGAEYNGKKVGSFGQLTCFSFYANKIITCGEGGMVITSDEKIAERAKHLRNLSFLANRRFWHEEIGFNYRMTNLQAALGLAQFERIEQLIDMRRNNAKIYNSLLSGVPGITLPVERPGVKNVYWMYSILVDKKQFGLSREELIAALKERGIEARTFFIPLHQQPILKKMKLISKEKFPIAESFAPKGMYLPSSSGLKASEIQYICQTVKDLGKKAK